MFAAHFDWKWSKLVKTNKLFCIHHVMIYLHTYKMKIIWNSNFASAKACACVTLIIKGTKWLIFVTFVEGMSSDTHYMTFSISEVFSWKFGFSNTRSPFMTQGFPLCHKYRQKHKSWQHAGLVTCAPSCTRCWQGPDQSIYPGQKDDEMCILEILLKWQRIWKKLVVSLYFSCSRNSW